MKILEVRDLSKAYPAFRLDRVSFSLEPGKITGFIGRNGAGKTTTLRSLMNFIHPDDGSVRFFGQSFGEAEQAIKAQVGFVSGGVDFYPEKKLRSITAVTQSFYDNWDDSAYRDCLHRFNLDENKTPKQLSEGMKVKYALTLALSHHAQLLILDEPTSGLDPVSREELLDDFLALSRQGTTILFSTHITSDLDKCADNILYIQKGRIRAEQPLSQFVGAYRAVELSQEQYEQTDPAKLIGCKHSKHGFTALIPKEDAANLVVPAIAADLDTIMVHLEQEGA